MNTYHKNIIARFDAEYARVATDDEGYRAHETLVSVLGSFEDDEAIDEREERIDFDEYRMMIAPEIAWDRFSEDTDAVERFFASIGCSIDFHEFYFDWGMPFATVSTDGSLDCLYYVPRGDSNGLWIAEDALEMWLAKRPLLVGMFKRVEALADGEHLDEEAKAQDEFIALYERVIQEIADKMVALIKEDMDYYATEEAYEEYCDYTYEED